MSLKLGKLAAAPRATDLKLVKYETKKLPLAPVGFGHFGLVSDFGMLGNNDYGDCVWAGAAHETMIWTAEGGTPAAFSDASVLGDYSAVTGFKPDDPNTDQGTDVHNALSYRRATGVADAANKRHQIGAYLSLSAGNWNQLLQALGVFGAVGIGIQFPESAMDQFNAGKPWNVVEGSPVDGGHYIPVVGRPSSASVYVVTWGRLQRMSKAFYKKYCDEAYAILSAEVLKGGKTPEGFDLSTLQSDLSAL